MTPFALVQQTRLLRSAADQIVLLQFVTATVPRVDPDKRLTSIVPTRMSRRLRCTLDSWSACGPRT